MILFAFHCSARSLCQIVCGRKEKITHVPSKRKEKRNIYRTIAEGNDRKQLLLVGNVMNGQSLISYLPEKISVVPLASHHILTMTPRGTVDA